LDQLGFRTMTKIEKEKTRKLIETEVSDVSTQETALSKLIMASFFEDKKLLIDATTAYQQAIKLASDVNSYQEAYQAFLLRTSLKDSKEKK
jgi:Tfp pilus assembly protein PilF